MVTVRQKEIMPFAETWFCLGHCSESRTNPEEVCVSSPLHPFQCGSVSRNLPLIRIALEFPMLNR